MPPSSSSTDFEIWEYVVFFGVLPLVGICLIALALWAGLTKCGKKSCMRKKNARTSPVDSSDVTELSKKEMKGNDLLKSQDDDIHGPIQNIEA
mmetsp:Transcript_9140/g.12440  ORF Transcript_9140/g.12440 Transcript_9140/m.12440 type:complete len:93 (+) Transcript_9140:381-659(+)|eukprot:CAMPEP_0185579486 /NCGR_PEP_ID=MMETSP0434-20130131/14929_1 /TAXON_ID=626734 ORGANISM="Favella taraikaensis, Strain Fe Narragansett Bay" /NCGR_SAMPLE_ID=MMETSP0434 /ASSEMBLY_ACC=CAM_ASM_000379 /LENGTH=92 /DNA_ID=CAMNT_0028197515 /DNA_START=349 /DNA_END=627 /DNA_ORIENTATION=-